MRTTKQLALDLLHADSEEEVIKILTDEGYWDNHDAWRLYGDKEGNFSAVGSQQRRPEAALVEKVINCVDARLLRECRSRGVDPESADAPRSVRAAVARYFEGGKDCQDDEAGVIRNWAQKKRTEHSRMITLAATGAKPRQKPKRHMCITIADRGEGQSPDQLPDTILSLNKRNKQRVRFVQGQFNMGGSGALRFCGQHGLQLVISRRDPEIADRERDLDASVDEWGITIVRREAPSDEGGKPRNSEFTYLAPLDAKKYPRRGRVLRFKAKTLPLMPDGGKAYAVEVPSGTAIKLYEYRLKVTRSNILRRKGLLYALERLMPRIALPIRLHECRGLPGKQKSSFETPLSGLVVRLEDGKGRDNIEFQKSATVLIAGTSLPVSIYAFKPGGATTYLHDEGVVLMLNGQSHGHFARSIFARKTVGLPKLKNELLVLVDCSGLGPMERENLFMTSRDRFADDDGIRQDIESAIERMLKTDGALRELQNRRRQDDVKAKLSDDRPLEQVLAQVFRASPALRSIFGKGSRMPNPFNQGKKGGGKKPGKDKGKGDFKGKRHPSYYRVPKVPHGKAFVRSCEQGRDARITFETDVENGYFERATDKGRFELEVLDGPSDGIEITGSNALNNGRGTLLIHLPAECEVGDQLTLQATVSDSTIGKQFITVVKLNVIERTDRGSSSGKRRKRKFGDGDEKGKTVEGISMPEINKVRRGDENWVSKEFTEADACTLDQIPEMQDGKEIHRPVFYVNYDNVSLVTEAKYSKQEAKILRAKFSYACVLIGLAMLRDEKAVNKRGKKTDDEALTVEGRFRTATRAIAPILIPMIDQLSGLNEDDLGEPSESGEDD